jgi:TFIIF-interacting CTD phosphatase-like protein
MKRYRKFHKNINHDSITEFGIVLDLDETLIKAENFKIPLSFDIHDKLVYEERIFTIKLIDCASPKGMGKIEYHKIIKRYNLDKFIRECNRIFRVVIVWSAGMERYVESIVDKIFPLDKHPYITYTRNQCDFSEGYSVKDLRQMYFDNPELNDIVPLNKMFVLDDNDYTFERNIKNGILIEKFLPLEHPETIFQDDGELRRVLQYVLTFKTSIY